MSYRHYQRILLPDTNGELYVSERLHLEATRREILAQCIFLAPYEPQILHAQYSARIQIRGTIYRPSKK